MTRKLFQVKILRKNPDSEEALYYSIFAQTVHRDVVRTGPLAHGHLI